MGIFSFTPQGPGKGVSKNERKLKRPFLLFYLMLANFTKFIKLSMLFTLTCLPVITIGPSICALTYISKNIAEDNPVFLISDYFEHFKKNFFKGLASFIITLVPAFSYFTLFFNVGAVPHFKMLLTPMLLINFIMLIMSFYIYPLIVFYDIPLWAVFKNSFLFALIKLPLNLLVALLVIAIVILSFGIHPTVGYIIMPLFLVMFINYFTTFSVWPTIKKNMEE